MSEEFVAIKELIQQGRKIAAIKLLREQTGCGLKEAKDQVEAIEEQMVANGEMEPRSGGCAGVVLLGIGGLATAASWLV